MGKKKVAAWWVSHMSDERTMQKINHNAVTCTLPKRQKEFLKHTVALMKHKSMTLNQN
jgi:hypothetical protein